MSRVFISYRRETGWSQARLVFHALRDQGFDVFIDVENIHGGRFDAIIMEQVASREHFVVILAPGSLERCAAPDDWFRREIEQAIATERNIVPLLVDGFRFDAGQLATLPESLTVLARHDGLNVPPDFFDEAMQRLCTRYLARAVPDAAPAKPAVIVEPGLNAAQCYNRGIVYAQQANLPQAIAYYTRALELQPDFVPAYNNRAVSRRRSGDLEGAIADYTAALEYDPAYYTALSNRGEAYFILGEYDAARADFEGALTVEPDYRFALAGAAIAHHALGHTASAIRFWQRLVKLNPSYVRLHTVWEELAWADPLVDEARRLVARLR